MEITAFTTGDSRLQKTWSGVPYFLLAALEHQGVKVNRVNMEFQNKLIWLFVKCCNRAIAVISNGKVYSNKAIKGIEHTPLFKKITQHKLQRALKSFPSADWNLVFDYNTVFPPAVSSAKICMLHDWNREYVLLGAGRAPTKMEKELFQIQKAAMEQADILITLYPDVKEHLDKQFSNVYCFGNGINSISNSVDLTETHYSSNSVLFIGRRRYKEGAYVLVNAVEMYNARHKEKIYAHIVGLTAENLHVTSPYVKFYGYLNKDQETHRCLYYQLLRESKLFCMPNSQGVGGQSLLEAAYWQLPLVVYPSDYIKMEYGEQLPCGLYCGTDSNDVCAALENIMEMPHDEYVSMCQKAYDMAKDRTWDTYAKKLLKLFEENS